MTRRYWLILLVAVGIGQPLAAQDRNSSWELLGEGYHLTGDSAVDPKGTVYFTDAPRNRILTIDLNGKIHTWREETHGAHGIAYGPDGRLYAGQHDRKRIVAFSREGPESVIAENVQTHHLIVSPRGEIYFTEPPASRVWIANLTGTKRLAFDGIQWPRGVRAAPDWSTLVVNEPGTGWVWTFRLRNDGSLADGRRFCKLDPRGESGSDAGGMAFDEDGLLYVATNTGIQVCDRGGRVIRVIKTPGPEGVSNVFFGGTNHRWLYAVEWNKVSRRSVNRSGPR